MTDNNDDDEYKYSANKYRCNVCGKNFHTKGGRDSCENSHE